MSQKPTHQLPCDYVIKIVGHYDFDFSEEILAIIKSKMTVKAHHTTATFVTGVYHMLLGCFAVR